MGNSYVRFLNAGGFIRWHYERNIRYFRQLSSISSGKGYTFQADVFGSLYCLNDGGDLVKIADVSFIVPSDETPRIQESHITIAHIICELVEEQFFKK